MFTQYVENIPIPSAGEADRKTLGELAERCGAVALARSKIETAVQHRLAQGFGSDPAGKSLGKLKEKVQERWEHPRTQLGAALKTSFKLPGNLFANPKTADGWEPYLTAKRNDVEKLRGELAGAEAEINDRVYWLFNLTLDEIKLLQREDEH